MKKFLALLLALILVLALFAGCGKKDEAPADDPKDNVEDNKPADKPEDNNEPAGEDKFLIGFTQPNMDDYAQKMVDCMTQACEELGMDILCAEAESSIEKQVADVEDMVAAGCDFIFIRAGDADALAVAAEYCKENGVPCVGAEFDVNSDACVSHFLFPEIGFGLGAGQAVVEVLEANPDLTLNMGHIWVNSSWVPENERWDSFCSVFQDYIDSGRVVILDEEESQNDSGAAMTIAENWLVEFPEMNCIFGNNDAMAYAAAGVVAANGYKMNEEFFVFGIGGDADGFAGVREGLMYSTSYAADMLDRQRYWVNLAHQYLTGEIELEESYSYTGAAELVSVQNIGDYEGV